MLNREYQRKEMKEDPKALTKRRHSTPIRWPKSSTSTPSGTFSLSSINTSSSDDSMTRMRYLFTRNRDINSDGYKNMFVRNFRCYDPNQIVGSRCAIKWGEIEGSRYLEKFDKEEMLKIIDQNTPENINIEVVHSILEWLKLVKVYCTAATFAKTNKEHSLGMKTFRSKLDKEKFLESLKSKLVR